MKPVPTYSLQDLTILKSKPRTWPKQRAQGFFDRRATLCFQRHNTYVRSCYPLNTNLFKEQSQRPRQASKESTNHSFSFRDWNMKFKPDQGEERIVLQTHQTCTLWLPMREWKPWTASDTGDLCNIIYADLNKPCEQVASYFWYSYFCGKKLKEPCPEHSLLSFKTTLGITTRRKIYFDFCHGYTAASGSDNT